MHAFNELIIIIYIYYNFHDISYFSTFLLNFKCPKNVELAAL